MTTTRELCRLLSATLHLPNVDRWAEQLGSRELLPGFDHEVYARDAARTAIAVIETGSLGAQDDDYGDIPFDAAATEQAEGDREAETSQLGLEAEPRVEGQGAAINEGAPEAGGAPAGEELAAEATPPPTTSITVCEQINGLRFYDQHSAEIEGPGVVAAGSVPPKRSSTLAGPPGLAINVGDLFRGVNYADIEARRQEAAP